MENQSYYRVWDGSDCNEIINDRHLVVNCTGCCNLSRPFTTHMISGRKDYYLLYLCKGTMRVLVNNKMEEMHAGQLIIFYPDGEYKYTKLGDEDVIYYWVHFTGFAAKEMLDNCRLYDHSIIDIGANEQLLRKFNNIFTDFIRRDHCFESSVASHLMSICVNLSRSMTDSEANSNTVNQDRIHASLMFLHRNFNSNVTIEQLANMEHLSVSHYRTIFKQCTNISPQNYIIALRIQRACELILQTDLTLKEIAELVGYHDQLYFSRIFKARTGIMPSNYKYKVMVS